VTVVSVFAGKNLAKFITLVGERKLNGQMSLTATAIQNRISMRLGQFLKTSLNKSTASIAMLPYKLISNIVENTPLI
jgi:hypothetical protein